VRKISEMITDVTRGIVQPWGAAWGGLRSAFRATGNLFWGKTPAYDNTIINFDLARQFYRNDGSETALGSGFCRPIIDLEVEFIGIPRASTEDDAMDDRLNQCFEIFWTDEIQQMIRNACRDSKTVVRIFQDALADPLMTMEEREHCRLEIIDPDRVTIQRSLRNSNIIDQAVIYHRWLIFDDKGEPEKGVEPKSTEHEILEIITPGSVTFFDRTDNVELTDLSYANRFGFVNLVEVWNEYDSSLSGGQSDLESVIPFIRALHDVLAQALQAHKYHSIPKVKFKLKEIEPFLKNNFPSAFGADGQLQPQTEISWRGKEILFLSDEEDAEFLEARSVLGDSRALAEFLIDCICIASQTPEWAFMRVDSGSANSDRNAQTVPFIKKIERKRRSFQRPIQDLLKMFMVINDFTPVRAKLSWDAIRADDQMVEMQALQQLIMGLEVAKQSKVISDRTYQEMIRQFIPMMKNPKQESKDAESNTEPALPLPAAGGNGSGNKNAVAIAGGPQGKNE
jgi:hypothetical protein